MNIFWLYQAQITFFVTYTNGNEDLCVVGSFHRNKFIPTHPPLTMFSRSTLSEHTDWFRDKNVFNQALFLLIYMCITSSFLAGTRMVCFHRYRPSKCHHFQPSFIAMRQGRIFFPSFFSSIHLQCFQTLFWRS